MKNIAIIGAGQLGSRHLQGVLKSEFPFNVYVVDPNEISRSTAESRANEIEHEHQVSYCQTISELPKHLDLVIVATNSNIRLTVLKNLVAHAKVDVLVLEKVLFQKILDYEEAQQIISSEEIKCYVNHARRMQSGYQELKELLSEYRKEKFEISAYGANWGLGCNGLHITDFICYLLEDTVTDYQTLGLDDTILESKRNGYREFTGTLSGVTERGNQFSVTSASTTNGAVMPISIQLSAPSIRISIQEGALPSVVVTESASKFKLQQKNLNLLFQSDLSKEIVQVVLEGGEPNLTCYNDAMDNHVKFITVLNKHIESLTGEKTELCPIT